MRLLFASTEFPTVDGGGGIGSYLANLAPALARRGHDVHVLVCRGRLPIADHVLDGVSVHERPELRFRGVERALGSRAFGKRIWAAVSTWCRSRSLGHFDVVEVPEWMAIGLGWSFAQKTALVAHLHTPHHVLKRYNCERSSAGDRAASWLERRSIATATTITVASRLLLDEVRQDGWRVAARAQIVRLPIDMAAWRDVAPPSTAPTRILAVGRVEGRKDPITLVNAAALVKSEFPQLELVFVGRSSGSAGSLPYREHVISVAQRKQVRCQFFNDLTQDGVRLQYEQSRIVVVPSRFESFSMAAIEAMAAGRPVICTERVGASEIVENRNTVVPVGDAHAMAQALRPFLESGDLADHAGRAARETVARCCDADMIAAAREDLYLSAAGAKR